MITTVAGALHTSRVPNVRMAWPAQQSTTPASATNTLVKRLPTGDLLAHHLISTAMDTTRLKVVISSSCCGFHHQLRGLSSRFFTPRRRLLDHC